MNPECIPIRISVELKIDNQRPDILPPPPLPRQWTLDSKTKLSGLIAEHISVSAVIYCAVRIKDRMHLP